MFTIPKWVVYGLVLPISVVVDKCEECEWWIGSYNSGKWTIINGGLYNAYLIDHNKID